MDILNESVCFRIDSRFTSRHAFALLSALQAFVMDGQNKTASWNKLYKQNRKYVLSLTLVCEQLSMLEFLVRWLKTGPVEKIDVATNLDGKTVNDFDLYVDISLDKVLDVVQAGKLHLTQGIGILIGANAGSLAYIEEQSSYKSGSVFCVGIECFPRAILEYIESKFSSVTHLMSFEVEDSMSEEVVNLIRSHESVIGFRGFATYGASCLHRPVLELNPIDGQFHLLTQWSNKYYVPIEIDLFSPDHQKITVVQNGVDSLWKMACLHRESVTTMAPETCTVRDAEDL